MSGKRMQFNPGSQPTITIMNDINNVGNGGLDLSPKYQRGYVWNNDFKNKLIYSLIKRYPIGGISIRVREEKNNKGALYEVVDGQQRLTTIHDFIYKEYKVSGEMARRITLDIKEYTKDMSFSGDEEKKVARLFKKLENKGGFSIKYNDLPQIVQGNIASYPLSTMNIANANDDEICEYFRFLQNQEVLRAGEIINSVPDTKLEKYLLQITDIEKLMKILSYSNKRKEFDKMFYSIIGLFDKKISFGTTNKEIQEYVSNKDSDLEGDALFKTQNMINNINTLICNISDYTFCSNKRFIKLLLLIAGFNYINFENNALYSLKRLERINDMLSSFNSAKRDIVSATFNDFTSDEIEEYRLIALFTKGAQTYQNAEDRCKELSRKILYDPKIMV